MRCKNQKRTLFLIPIFCYAAVWSYTATKSIAPFRRRETPSNLLFSQLETAEHAILSDSELMQSLIKAKTTRDVDRTLRDAFETRANQPTHDEGEDHTFSTIQQDHTLSITVNVSEETTERIDLNDTAINNTIMQFPQFSLNVTAAALRRMAHVSIMEARAKNSDFATQQLRKQLLVSLLETIGSQIILAQRSPQGLLGVYALADILQALAILSHNGTKKNMQPLASLVMEMMARHNIQDLYKLGPIRLVQCLQASAKLQLPDQQLRHMIYQRLLKPDAVSKIPARYLSHGLSALASLNTNDRDGMLLTRAFMRRLRKQNVREDATIKDLCRALVASNQLLKNGGMDDFEDEAAIFGFTTLRAILEKRRNENGHIFTATEMSDLISSWASLSNNNREDTVIEELLEICQSEKTLDRCNLRQLESIVGSVEQLHITNHAETMKLGGERLVALVEEQQSSTSNTFNPKTISNILRCPVLLHRRNNDVMKPYLEASSRLFVDEAFLRRCNVGQIANFLWFMSVARWHHEGVLEALGQRILDPRLVDSCSPKLASRILGTYTSILCLEDPKKDDPSEGMLKLATQLFHDYGGHLLSSQLSPAEVSSALIAYAKASYVQDMGIYDHLVSSIASMASRCTVRQLAQSLWSCGKMIVWERLDYEEDEIKEPPYLESAKTIASELSVRASVLSSADVTQCIWALGRLRITDAGVVSSIAYRAKELVPVMNAVEISNILWGLGKLRFKDPELVATLTNRLTTESLRVSAIEAASTLYALGRLRVRDEEVFDKLSSIMMAQIEDASAQAIANALWAYQTVRLRPPKDLLNLWATQKLGLVGVQLQKTLHDS